MLTRIRSYSKINLGLRIGPTRPDGYHGLCTLYQTIGLYDVLTVSAQRADNTSIHITCNHPGVPCDSKNTVWKMVEWALDAMGISAEVHIDIDKRLPVQGGLGAGSANAVAALLGIERELNESLTPTSRIWLAGQVGSDCPLFLCGGTSLGLSRGEMFVPYPDLPPMPCVIAAPAVGVSTPLAFKEWDQRMANWLSDEIAAEQPGDADPKGQKASTGALTRQLQNDRLEELSCVYASVFSPAGNSVTGASGVSSSGGDLAGNYLSELVRTGIANDFEEVAFAQHPSLRDILTALEGTQVASPDEQAITAMLSGSGSSLFGLYRTEADAEAAKQRVEALGTRAMVTTTLPRNEYWRTMFEG
ncbi:MAG: 4-(cytidine 5'-diphospho)-2-C-methyl-D-erythritol kinase [Acidobacteria bacterium]|nr:4-(cytidine 5'-diphospho)-2-C-methyl-D-erythritol kinase [Acidobacteriota bacterium]